MSEKQMRNKITKLQIVTQMKIKGRKRIVSCSSHFQNSYPRRDGFSSSPLRSR